MIPFLGPGGLSDLSPCITIPNRIPEFAQRSQTERSYISLHLLLSQFKLKKKKNIKNVGYAVLCGEPWTWKGRGAQACAHPVLQFIPICSTFIVPHCLHGCKKTTKKKQPKNTVVTLQLKQVAGKVVTKKRQRKT